MDQNTLSALQATLRNVIVESISDCLAELKKQLPDFSAKYNALVLLESRLNDANLQRIEGTLSDDDLQLRYNQLRADLLLFINALEINDFAMPVAGAPKGKTGSLLYKIPTTMTMLQETKCVVRLAYDKAVIIRNIELTTDVRIKPVRVSEVMQVELIDPTEPAPFRIRPISDEEQFLETDDYTEWVFYVEPLLEGTFPLVLKISVVEIVLGKERMRNLTYEEDIQITATAQEVEEPTFKPTGISIDATTPSAEAPASPISDAPMIPPQAIEIDRSVELPELEDRFQPAPPAPAPQPAPSTEPLVEAPVRASRKRSMMPLLAAMASVLLVITVAFFSVISFSGGGGSSNTEDESNPTLLDSSAVEPMDSLMMDSLR